MANLVIDIGNTNTKLAVFEHQELKYFEKIEQIDEMWIGRLIKKFAITHSTLSTVDETPDMVLKVLRDDTEFIEFSTTIKTEVDSKYGSPETLGPDRWAKVIAAFYLYGGKNTLIIDCGTCITYDLITHNGVYEGGNISLGVTMRFKALHAFTGKLPYVEKPDTYLIPDGTDTRTAILHGVLQGAAHEVEGFMAGYDKKYTDLHVLLTGGDADFLLAQLKNSIFAPQITKDPHLVLRGLNEFITLETNALKN